MFGARALAPLLSLADTFAHSQAEDQLSASAPPHSVFTSMQIRICLIFAALQVFCRVARARVLTAHVLEKEEGIRRVDDPKLARNHLIDRLEAPHLEVFSNVSSGRFDDGTTAGSRKNVSTEYVDIQRVTKGRSTFYSSNLFDCWRRLRNHKDDPPKPFWPLNWGDIVGYTFAAVSLFIAAGGGIGGGGILVPLYILVMGFPTNTAVALSNITIVGGAISNFLFNVGRRHAFFDRPLIDWNIILAMEPATILGALLGGYLNKATPNWLTTILLAALLTLLTYKLVDRAVLTWRKENLQLKHAKARAEDESSQPLLHGVPQQSLESHNQQEILNRAFAPEPAARPLATQPIAAGVRLGQDSAWVASEPAPAGHSSPLAYTSLGLEGAEGAHLSTSFSGSFRAKSLIRRVSLAERLSNLHSMGEHPSHDTPALPEQAHGDGASGEAGTAAGAHTVPGEGVNGSADAVANGVADKLIAHDKPEPQVPPFKVALLVLMFACIVASDSIKERTACGTWEYWLVVLSAVPVILIISCLVRAYLVRDFDVKQASGYVWTEGDVEWSPRNTIIFPALSSLAGLIAGMFGVGGGIVKGPLMLEMGVLPDVAAATSATMIMFTAASASVVYLSFGGIPFDYGLATFLVGLIFTLIGQVACYWLMKALNRRSIIVIAMALLMLISMGIIYYEAVISTISAVQDHRLWDFGTICEGVPVPGPH
ncbi:probable sulfite exporter TauE/SafE family protein 3 [Coccomyxa sp. Obi]|nr:probable sulfite exporter TauE/SafE family protein 3 [Coccomyxa sp. Obi]